MRIVDNIHDATEFQLNFLLLMAGHEYAYKQNLDIRLEGIAHGVGVEFKKR